MMPRQAFVPTLTGSTRTGRGQCLRGHSALPPPCLGASRGVQGESGLGDSLGQPLRDQVLGGPNAGGPGVAKVEFGEVDQGVADPATPCRSGVPIAYGQASLISRSGDCHLVGRPVVIG
jgi:hypothetical protein